MTGKAYQELAMRTNDGKATERLLSAVFPKGTNIGGVLNGCLGLAGEAGEFNDMVKKTIFHETPMDIDHAKKELGDVLWYISMICFSFGWDMEEIMQMNIDKLKARYPEGFSVEHSLHRAENDV